LIAPSEYVSANFDAAPDAVRVRELAAAPTREHEQALAGIVPDDVDTHA
jgi:hypothetical protein